MYDPLAKYYEEIFPVSRAQVEFIASSVVPAVSGTPMRLLDVGCAVGDLASALNEKGLEVDGIDLNPMMIRRARERHVKRTVKGGLRFFEMDMLEIDRVFEAHCFDVLVCLGNTLVHLPGRREIEGFLSSASTLLRGGQTPGKGGTLVLQILNYDFLLTRRPESLPGIETENVLFERRYLYPNAPDGSITFMTRLTIKESEEVFEDSLDLYPLGRGELEELLSTGGYKDVKFYGEFDGSPLMQDSLPLIVVASSA